METILICLLPIMAVIGAITGRMDGGGIVKTPEIVERLLCIALFPIACLFIAPVWWIVAFAGIFGLATGHGQYFLARVNKQIEPEKVDFIVKLFFGDDPRTEFETSAAARSTYMEIYGMTKLYWRCVFGMFVTGSLVGLPAAILAFSFGHIIPGILFASTGLAKALAYIIGYELWEETEKAEYINGAFRNLLAWGALIILC